MRDLISSTGVIYSTGAWGCSHQIYYSFSASASLLRIHSLLITISSSSRRSLKSLQCEEANSYILSMSTAPVISLLLMITRIFVPSSSTAKRSSSNSLSGSFLRIESVASNLTSSRIKMTKRTIQKKMIQQRQLLQKSLVQSMQQQREQ